MKSSSQPFVCGWCLGAASSAEGADLAHMRCRGQYPHTAPGSPLECACAVGDHVLTGALAERMASFCHLTPELVRYYHVKQRGVA